jgi:hypothetical protein
MVVVAAKDSTGPASDAPPGGGPAEGEAEASQSQAPG